MWTRQAALSNSSFSFLLAARDLLTPGVAQALIQFQGEGTAGGLEPTDRLEVRFDLV